MSGRRPIGATGTTATGCSLWLMPEGAPRERLQALIDGLAGRLATARFAPHLTLLSAIAGPNHRDVLERARAVAAELLPVRVHLEGVAGRDEYFRCLYLKAAPDATLAAAHAAAARAFGREPDPAFEAHLSLVYGVLPPATRQDLTRELAGSLVVSFEAVRLHAWLTSGAVGEWRELGSFRLSPQAVV